MIAIAHLLSFTHYLLLAIYYLLSYILYLKLAITCKNLFPFAHCCTSRNFSTKRDRKRPKYGLELSKSPFFYEYYVPYLRSVQVIGIHLFFKISQLKILVDILKIS